MAIKKFLCCLIVVCLPFFIWSCDRSPVASSTPTINRKVLPISSENGGYSMGLYDMDGEIESERHLFLEDGQPFQKILSFGNYVDEENTYRLLVFLNYEQVAFSIDSEEPSRFYEFTAGPQEARQFSFQLSPLPNGDYQLLFLFVKDPANQSLDEEYRKDTELSHLLSLRYSFTVGDSGNTDIPSQISLPETAINQTSLLDGILVNQSPDTAHGLDRLLTVRGKPMQPLDFYAHIGNSSDKEVPYALFWLYDWEQVPSSDGAFVSYFLLQPNTLASLKETIQTPGEDGVHNLTAVCIQNPYLPADNRHRVDFSLRIGVGIFSEKEG